MTVMPQNVMPKNVIVVLLDSLNRHMLSSYGGAEFDTPNLDRFAHRAVQFDKHFVGSLPCMPARHDVLCGALDFPWKPWGSIELWEEPITQPLRRAGVTTMLVSDHPHLFETGGENYHTEFRAWEYLRGHEGDPWKTRADPSAIGAPSLPPAKSRGAPYDVSRTWYREELDFPGPRTMSSAAQWLRDNAGAHDRFLLFIDEFDPHEPFDTPAPWANRYDPTWRDDIIIWPPYAVGAVKRGVITEREASHIRANYGAKLSMIDHWFGRLLDVVDEKDLWADTAIIVCTDHGHYLGEKDIFGKPGVPHYEPLGHTPLFIAWPGVAHRRVSALTTNVDIHATIADVFGVASAHRTHGRSMVPLVQDTARSIRDWALAGVFGRWVHVIDGARKYARAPVNADNLPLSMWSNRWSTMPVHAMPELKLPKPNRAAWLDFMPGSDVPVIRQPFRSGDLLPYWSRGTRAGEHHCYRLDIDPDELENRVGTRDEADMVELLRVALAAIEAPAEQLQRLGIA
jgi:arylsulfatase A-like enzyme